jgi:MFS family permease
MVCFVATIKKATCMDPSSKKIDLLCVFLIYSLDAFGIAIVYPIFTPLFLMEATPFFSLDTSFFQKTLLLGVLISLFPIAQFVGVPFIGDFSDRAGRKKVFRYTLLGSTFAYFLCFIAVLIHSLMLLFIGRLFSGFFAGNASLCFASISDLSKTELERTKNFGLIAAFGGISFLLSIASAEFFFHQASLSPWKASCPFLLISFFSLMAFFFMQRFFTEARSPMNNASFHLGKGFEHILSSLKMKPLKTTYFLFFFFLLAWIASMQFYPSILFKTYHKTPASFTVNLLLVGAMWSLANFFVQKKLVKYFSPSQILSATLPLLFLFLLICSLSQSYLAFSIHFSLSVFLAALCWSNSIAFISLSAPLQIQGRIMGVNQSFASISNILAGLLGGLFAGINPKFVLFLSAICIFISFLFLRKAQKSSN